MMNRPKRKESPCPPAPLDHPGIRQKKPTSYHPFESNQEDAVEESWHREYIGCGADALWDHIKLCCRSENVYTSIVQSSGMGKSRAMDELSKTHFTIPINLRERGSTGYPPADANVRDYLMDPERLPPVHLNNRMRAFLGALFDHTAETVQSFDDSELDHLPATFRRKMTERQEGQAYFSVNDYRGNFYRNVIEKARTYEHQLSSRNPLPGRKDKSAFSLPRACKELVTVIQAIRAQREGTPTPDEDCTMPEVIIAIDEAHTMTTTDIIYAREPPTVWSNFNHLQLALRSLNEFPIFSLFCSTTRKVSLLAPSSGHENPNSVLIEPFSDLPFDILADKVQLSESLDLEKVTSDAHIVRLGRPLFATSYEAGDRSVKEDMVDFAIAKLLHSDAIHKTQLSNDEMLACLSHRLPIELISRTLDDHDKEERQVDGHMRVCLKIDATGEKMTTVSASEPILSEAAYRVMSRPSFSVPKAMQSVLDSFSIDKGDHAEFIVMLMFTIARDKTVVRRPDWSGSRKSRILHVPTFLTRHLFRSPPELRDIATDFADSRMHFNHYIKVHECSGIDAESLLLLSTRGAAVLFANGHFAVDGIQPFLVNGTTLVRSNLGLILWRSENDAVITEASRDRRGVFGVMDPYRLHILEEDEAAVPLIKIVFALGTKTPGLDVVRRPASDEYDAVVYEIWCAGMASDILGAIDLAETTIWEGLLKASYAWKSMYKMRDGDLDARRRNNPGVARDGGHWNPWCVR